ILQDRLFKNPKVEIEWNHTVEEILGDENPLGVTGVRVKSTADGSEKVIPCDGFFVAIGHAPSSELVKDSLKMQSGGYVWVEPGSTRTSQPGIFAAG
ncbi:NAD(P)/FAD-dependent oxidoreductase, partial [Thioclava sp. UBA3469]